MDTDMRKTLPTRDFPSPKFRYLLLLVAISPFMVGFSTPDSSGTYLGAGIGKGAYHLVGCKGNFDSRFLEGQITTKHRFEEDTASHHGSWFSGLRPGHNSIGGFVGAIDENVTVLEVKKDNKGVPYFSDTVGSQFEKRGFVYGAYWTGDWHWVGLTTGIGGLYRSSEIPDLDSKKVDQLILGLRLGDYDRFYVSAEAFGSSPSLSGGGTSNLGIGGKWHHTRVWLGGGQYPGKIKGADGIGILKISQGYGPYTFFFTAQGNSKSVPPANLGIEKENGISVYMEYRLP